ncbi:hypothetical protein BH11BAC1_BH11BAC1_07600 [soil metagenome]
MKKLYSLIVLIFISGLQFVKGQTIFGKEIITSPYYTLSQIIPTKDSGYAAITNYGNFIKLNKYGDTTWTKKYTIYPSYPVWTYFIETHDGGFLILEETYYVNYGRVFIRINSSGDTLWTRYYTQGFHMHNDPLRETTDGNFIFASYLGGNYYTMLFKMDSLGNPLWTTTFDYGASSAIHSAIETIDGGYISIGGFANDFGLLQKTDSNGNLLWAKYLQAGPYRLGINSITSTADSGFVICGSFIYSVYSFGVIIKIDSIGNVNWAKKFKGNLSGVAHNCFATYDGNFLISGEAYDTNFTYPNTGILIKINSLGDTLWTKCSNDSLSGLSNVSQTFDSGYIMLSSNNSTSYILKTDSNGISNCISPSYLPLEFDTFIVSSYSLTADTFKFPPNVTTTGLDVESVSMTSNDCFNIGVFETYSLNSIMIFPNPTSNKIVVQSLESEIESLNIFNLLGESFFYEKDINCRLLTVDCGLFKPGIYFVQIQTSDGTVVQKLIRE